MKTEDYNSPEQRLDETGLADQAQQLKERAQVVWHDADQYIRANPVPAVLTALAVGFALGLLSRVVEPAPRRDPVHETLDELRSLFASGAKRGKKAYAQSADAVREAVEQAVEKARDIDVDPVAKWWKRLWS